MSAMLLRRLGVTAAGLLLGAAGWAAPAMADICLPDDPNCGIDNCPPEDPFCEPAPTELGTATGHANPKAATGLDTAAEAITTARTRQEG